MLTLRGDEPSRVTIQREDEVIAMWAEGWARPPEISLSLAMKLEPSLGNVEAAPGHETRFKGDICGADLGKGPLQRWNEHGHGALPRGGERSAMVRAELLESVEISSLGGGGAESEELLSSAGSVGVATAMIGAHRIDEEREAIEQGPAPSTRTARQGELVRVKDDDRRARRKLREGRRTIAIHANLAAAPLHGGRLLSYEER